MAKNTTRWVCTECDEVVSGWFGKCPSCAAWNTIEQRGEGSVPTDRVVLSTSGGAPVSADVSIDEAPRRNTGVGEVDRVLGGGLVTGSVVLVGGPPGIGKSTLLLQVG